MSTISRYIGLCVILLTTNADGLANRIQTHLHIEILKLDKLPTYELINTKVIGFIAIIGPTLPIIQVLIVATNFSGYL